MKLALVVLASFAIAAPALAQTPAARPESPANSSATLEKPGASPDDAGTGGRGRAIKALRESCREEDAVKGLEGPARREAVTACVVRERPDLAGREQCRTEGFGKGLRKQELHAFVKDCLRTKS